MYTYQGSTLVDTTGVAARSVPFVLAAFNVANAIGPLLGGMAIAAGFGLMSTGYVGSALALAGLGMWAASAALSGRTHEVLE